MKKEQRAMHLVAIEEKVVFYLWIQYKKKEYKTKGRSIRSINPLKFIKRIECAEQSEA